ncbi:hypothetical protein Bbelb_354700 [Branchiostoma belcheri]|nr:hypothetical protein Bbelb_354700 [Branchiostoma belcheri]
MEQRSVEVLRLTAGETTALVPGVNLICKERGNFIIYKDPANTKEPYKACRNICKHQGGTFVRDVEDSTCRKRLLRFSENVGKEWRLRTSVARHSQGCAECKSVVCTPSLTVSGCVHRTLRNILRCTKHGWKLDPSSMKYVNPPDSFRQDKLVPELDEDGGLALVELIPPKPWDNDARRPQTIRLGEVQLTFFAHACMELKLGDKTMFFDPWLTGPAFARGWWLLHEPPADWLERLSRADLIYISHVHSDHLRETDHPMCTQRILPTHIEGARRWLTEVREGTGQKRGGIRGGFSTGNFISYIHPDDPGYFSHCALIGSSL